MRKRVRMLNLLMKWRHEHGQISFNYSGLIWKIKSQNDLKMFLLS